MKTSLKPGHSSPAFQPRRSSLVVLILLCLIVVLALVIFADSSSWPIACCACLLMGIVIGGLSGLGDIVCELVVHCVIARVLDHRTGRPRDVNDDDLCGTWFGGFGISRCV